jgi:DNA (cytosine-5)-methyltransferase 1
MTAFNTMGVDRDTDGLDVFSEFTGFSGDFQGILKVPGTRGRFAANHDPYVLSISRENFPDVEHYEGDVQRHDVTKFQPCALFAASPACPKWTNAAGVVRDFDKSNQEPLPGMPGGDDEETVRSRLLMDEVHRYLNAMWISGQPVLAGVVENVIECRKWDQWRRWLGEFHKLGYKTRVIAFNSMHAEPVRTLRAPQSRDRLYVAYWLEAIGRDPDFDKWIRPTAWCPRCDKTVKAVQVFTDPTKDMGRYRSQYVYRCPDVRCRGMVVEPETLGAHAAIDWTLKSQRIGDRKKPLAAKTMARIGTGVLKFAVPYLAPAGGTWREQPTPITEPMPTRTTRETDGVAVPPMLVPVEGRPGKDAQLVSDPARTQTCRNETGLASIPPVVVTLRGGGSAKAPTTTDRSLTTVCASGNHHGVVSKSIDMLVPYYGNGNPSTPDQPIGTLPTRDRYAHARSAAFNIDPEIVAREVATIDLLSEQITALPKRKKGQPKSVEQLELEALADASAERMADAGVNNIDFRMLEPHEIQRAMSFDNEYRIPFGSKRQIVRGLGNAVTAPVAEVLYSALVEAITGVELERSL